LAAALAGSTHIGGERIPPRSSVKSLFTLLTQHRPYDSRWEAQAIRFAPALNQGHMSAISASIDPLQKIEGTWPRR
jgi:hypothetical protein